MFPRIEEVVQCLKGDSEEKLLVTHGEAERVRTGRAMNYFGDDPEVIRYLIYLILVEVGQRLDIGASVTIFAEISQQELSPVSGASNQQVAPLRFCIKVQHAGPDFYVRKRGDRMKLIQIQALSLYLSVRHLNLE